MFQGVPVGIPEPFAELPDTAKVELLVTYIDWSGFADGERADAINRILDGESLDFLMDGVNLDDAGGQTIEQVAEEERQGRHEDWMEEEREYHRPFEGFPDEKPDVGFFLADSLPVRPLTAQLIAAVLLDAWPGPAAIVDFGIDSTEHLGALQHAIKFGEVTPQELDAAMCCGAKLTEIVQRGDNPYRDVVFNTSWDKMFPEPRDEPTPDRPTSAKDRFKEILSGTLERSSKETPTQAQDKTKTQEHER